MMTGAHRHRVILLMSIVTILYFLGVNPIHGTELQTDHISISLGENEKVLIDGFYSIPSGTHQLLKPPSEGGGSGLFLQQLAQETDERGGIRLRIINRTQYEEVLFDWEKAEFDLNRVTVPSASHDLSVVISLPEEGAYLDLEVHGDVGSVLPEQIEISFWPEIGGDFRAIPTEGPDDFMILTVADRVSGPSKVTHIEVIDRTAEAEYLPAQRWWAIADKNKSVVFAVLNGTSANLEQVERWSGHLMGGEALRVSQRLRLGDQATNNVVSLRLLLLENLSRVSALYPQAAIAIRRSDRSDTSLPHELTIVAVEPISEATISLYSGDSRDAFFTTRIECMSVGDLQSFPLPDAFDLESCSHLVLSIDGHSLKETIYPVVRVNLR